ncbi:MAG: 2OG-Fe(II) oxygenase family protein [Woeseiaceae bacterium]|nr:2OG-Fe(II) oxygenase family protein [Woeseiaceae bacterium]
MNDVASQALPFEQVDTRRLRAGEIDDARLQAQLRRAASGKAFLALEHVFDPSLRRALTDCRRGFFELPDDDPRKQAICVTGRRVKHGWMPLYGEPSYQPGTVAHVESFDCGRARRGSDDPDHTSIWPDLPGFQPVVRQAWDALSGCGFALLEALALTAGIERRYFADRCGSQDLSTMRLLHYPGVPAATRAPAHGRDVGIAAHTDFECITLLCQSSAGLELRGADGRWYDAPAAEDCAVVLFGDMLERWTNGTYRATGHRVRLTSEPRFSTVLFFAVDDDVSVAPLAPFQHAGNPPRYAPVTQRQHSHQALARAERYRDEAVRA